MTPLSHVTLRAMTLLLDGEWHDYWAVQALAIRVAPPGIAKRIHERDRAQRTRAGKLPAAHRVPRTDEELVLLGAREMFRRSMGSSGSMKRFLEVEPRGHIRDGGPRRIRIRPEHLEEARKWLADRQDD